MTITSLSSRELNHNIGRAKRATQGGPVIITDRGKPAHVLLSYEQYQKLSGTRRTLAEALAMPPGGEDIEFEPERMKFGLRIPDLD
ncbi:MAG: type II toxin-antitoxin system Phd/YefM family antitoxin [Salinisphaera sp.]|nr:type II toxin-antitoxin system Phd/YefM family antitoxin [Salinisphaera sp.]